MAGDDRDGEDPFAQLRLDEDFVRSASVAEQSAADRVARLQRIDAEHRRLREERQAQRTSARARWGVRRRAARDARRMSGRGGRRERWTRRATVVGVLVALAGLAAWNLAQGDDARASAPGLGRLWGDGTSDSYAGGRPHPPAGVEAAADPIGEPAPLVSRSDAYRFVQTQPGADAPVAYDPCRPIHVVLNERTAPLGGDLIVQEALAAASRATGLQFVVDGPTDEAPSEAREPYQPERYPGRWAPVLIAWSDPTETPRLAGDVAGLGGSSWLQRDGRAVYVSGSVELDGPDLQVILARPGGRDEVRAVVEHELAHVLGLDHVNDPSQLMNPEGAPGVTSYADGDLTGLSELGQGRCFPDI